MKKFIYLSVICALVASCGVSSVQYAKGPELVLNEAYADEATRYKQNIAVKDKGENFVTYEYKDVRVDELATLAIEYCAYNAQGTQAQLREIILYRNNARRATFDCVNLAIEQ